MRYDLETLIKDLDGAPVLESEGGPPYTLRAMLTKTALFTDQVKPPSADDKRLGFKLAKRLKKAGKFVELTAEEVTFLKARAEVMWMTLALGVLEEILENPVTAPDQPAADIPAEPATA